MIDRHREQWEALAAEDPFWAVLTDPRMKGGKWDRTAFFQTGNAEITDLLQTAAGLGIDVKYGRALDYGCGVGRLSRALAKSFAEVVALDISENMLTLARAEHRDAGNITFVRGSGSDLHSVADSSIDFVYSNIVLQHVPRPVQQKLIGEFCRVLRPGGALVFQTPSRPLLGSLKGMLHLLAGNRMLNLARRIKHGPTRVMEMHTFRKERVTQLLRDAGMEIIAVHNDDAAGAAFASFRYISVKR